MARNTTRSWTTAQIEEIVRLYTVENWGVRKIARKFGVGYKPIKTQLVKRGKKIRAGAQSLLTEEQKKKCVARYLKGETLRDIAADHKCAIHVIRRALHQHGVGVRKWEEITRQRMAEARPGQIPMAFYHSLKSRVATRKLKWELTREDIEEMFQRQDGKCYYSSLPLKMAGLINGRNPAVNHPLLISVDRRESLKGYTKDNSVLCCRFVNLAKNRWEETVFTDSLRQLAESMSGRIFSAEREKAEDSLTA